MPALDAERTASAHVAAAVGPQHSRLRDGSVAALRMIASVGVLGALYLQAPWDRSLEAPGLMRLVAWLLLLGVVVTWQIRGVLRSRWPWLRMVEAATLSVALLLVPFASAYLSMGHADAGSFTQPLTRTDAFYFTVTVFSTVGFGDVAPVSETARLIVTVQMLADLVLVGVIVKLLVGAAQWRRSSLGAVVPRRTGGRDDDED